MDTRAALLAAAQKVLEEEGEAQFSTRSVCAIAKVTPPMLYRHYRSADGLLSAAIAEAFAQFLESKRATAQSTDPVVALREGWNDYVRFAAARPRLYAAMMGCLLDGAAIPAAERAFALLTERLAVIASEAWLALTIEAAADLLWASANAAPLLHVTAWLRKAPPPSSPVLEQPRENAMRAILKSEPEGVSR
jgi:AcrR family transcriptional regulator